MTSALAATLTIAGLYLLAFAATITSTTVAGIGCVFLGAGVLLLARVFVVGRRA